MGVEEGEGSAKDAADGGGHGGTEELSGGSLRRMGRLMEVRFGFSTTSDADGSTRSGRRWQIVKGKKEAAARLYSGGVPTSIG